MPVATDEALADPKAIGEDVEQLAIDAVPGLEPADARDDWFDAMTVAAVGPRTAERVVFAGIPIVPSDTHVEIKATQRRVSNGSRDRPGCWYIKRDQHDQRHEERACYLLTIYDDAGAAREVVEIVLAPASIIDECVADRWYDVDRREGEVAQLPWPQILGDSGGGDGE
jgi:hypothetical protein